MSGMTPWPRDGLTVEERGRATKSTRTYRSLATGTQPDGDFRCNMRPQSGF